MGTDEYSTDEGKRKRETRDQEGVSTKSKKVSKSPEKGRREEKLDKIMEMLSTLTGEIRELRTEQKSFREDLNKLNSENNSLRRENKEIKEQIKVLNGKLDSLESDKRRNNIVIQGLRVTNEDQGVMRESIGSFLNKSLGVEVDVKAVRKLGERICLVELENVTSKVTVMKNKSKLRDYKAERVFINDDLTKNEREIQGRIRSMAQEERKKGKVVKIGFQKIYIDGKEWRWNKEKEQLVKVEFGEVASNMVRKK